MGCNFRGTLVFGLYVFYIKNESQISPENLVTAYYDALDFNEFEKSYQFIDPESKISISQFMLEVSVTDGLLSSYAKLDAISTETITETDSLVTLKVHTDWITPLEKISKTDYKTVVKRNRKWFLKLDKVDSDLPPDQLYSNNVTGYFNQGRRTNHHRTNTSRRCFEATRIRDYFSQTSEV